MSKYKIMAVAVAAALAAPVAFATSVNVGVDGTPTIAPKNLFTDPDAGATNSTTVDVLANATSVYLGRTTGYNIRVTLSQGEFYFNPGAIAQGGIAAVALAGGGAGQNTATFAVTPHAVDGVREGDGIRFNPGDFAIVDLMGLRNGGSVSLAVQVFDPVGGNQLGDTINAELIRTVEGWAISYAGGNETQRIDVGAASSKMWFGNTTVGSGNAANIFNAGQVNIGLNPDLTALWSGELNPAVATAAVTLEGNDFAPFERDTDSGIYLSNNSDCSSEDIYATIAADGQSATFPATSAVNTVNGRYLCFDADGATQIARQQVVATTIVSQASHSYGPTPPYPVDPSPAVGSGDTLTEMRYNGTVVRVDHFNPASNPGQQSYLRVINPSNTPGLVTVEAICQDGSMRPTTASFTLGAGASRQVNSGDLEAGGNGIDGGVGACSGGKSRLIVTGEFANMGVQNFLRNSLQGTVINTHINNVTDEESKD